MSLTIGLATNREMRGGSSSGGLTPYEGFIATRAGGLEILSTNNKQILSYSEHVATDNITSLKLMFQNFRLQSGVAQECGNGATATVCAWVEYPLLSTPVAVLFSASDTGNLASVPSAGATTEVGVTLSDALSITIPDGATFAIRSLTTTAGTSVMYSRRKATNDVCRQQNATSWTANTAKGDFSALGSTITGYVPPLAIVGMTTKATVLMMGDSKMWASDETDLQSDRRDGYCRSLPATMAFVNEATGASRASDVHADGFQATRIGRSKLLRYASNYILNLGINDGGSTGATIFGYNQSNFGWTSAVTGETFNAWGKKFLLTVTPRASDATDAWVVAANQTTINQANCQAYNALVRAGAAWFTDYFEITRGVLENPPTDSYKWYIPANAVTSATGDMASGTRTVTLTSGAFDAAHVGTCIKIANATGGGAATLRTVITAVTNSTTCTTLDAASTPGASGGTNAITFGGLTTDGLHEATAGYVRVKDTNAIDSSRLTYTG